MSSRNEMTSVHTNLIDYILSCYIKFRRKKSRSNIRQEKSLDLKNIYKTIYIYFIQKE